MCFTIWCHRWTSVGVSVFDGRESATAVTMMDLLLIALLFVFSCIFVGVLTWSKSSCYLDRTNATPKPEYNISIYKWIQTQTINQIISTIFLLFVSFSSFNYCLILDWQLVKLYVSIIRNININISIGNYFIRLKIIMR